MFFLFLFKLSLQLWQLSPLGSLPFISVPHTQPVTILTSLVLFVCVYIYVIYHIYLLLVFLFSRALYCHPADFSSSTS